MKAWVRPYMQRQAHAGRIVAAGQARAATAKTGSNRNSPSMRAANNPASATLARRSEGVNFSLVSAGMRIIGR